MARCCTTRHSPVFSVARCSSRPEDGAAFLLRDTGQVLPQGLQLPWLPSPPAALPLRGLGPARPHHLLAAQEVLVEPLPLQDHRDHRQPQEHSQGRMVDKGNGTTVITGRFKGHVTAPDFRMVLTTNVSNADFQMGYCVTGTLERGKGELQLTHYAMVKRRGY